jgi:hypothetical protein
LKQQSTDKFSPGTPASSTTKTGHHNVAEILLKVALNTKNSKKSTDKYGVPLSQLQPVFTP